MVFGLKEINQIFGSFFNRTFELNNCKLFCGGKTVQTHIFAVAELRVGWGGPCDFIVQILGFWD